MIPLQIFEKHPTADAYRVGGFYSPYALVSKDKRFSDAELAAEWWESKHQQALMRSVCGFPNLRLSADLDALERFATRPHASDSDYQ